MTRSPLSLQIITHKRIDLEGFASYAQQLHQIELQREKEQEMAHYVTTLLTSLLASGVVVPKEGRLMVEEMKGIWHDCEIKVQEGRVFVDSQTPIKAEGLLDGIKVHVHAHLTCLMYVHIVA